MKVTLTAIAHELVKLMHWALALPLGKIGPTIARFETFAFAL